MHHRTIALGLTILLAAGCGRLGASSPPPGGGSTAATSVAGPAEPSPKVEIVQPARGAFLAPGPVAVQGRVREAGGARVSAVELNGRPVAVEADGTFRGMITLIEGLNVVEASCRDAAGRQGSAAVGVLAGAAFKPLSEPIRNSTVARVSDATLDAIGKLGEGAIWNTDWTATLRALNPIFDDNFLWMKVWIDIQQVRFHDVYVTIDSKPGHLLGTIEVRQPVFDVTVVADLGFARIGPFAAVVQADQARVEDAAALGVRSDGVFSTTMGAPTVAFSNFRMTVANGIVDAAVQLFARDAIERAIRGWVEDAFQQDLPPFIDRSLADFLQQSKPWNVLGKTFQIDVRGERIEFDEAGALIAVRYDARSGPTPTAAGAAAPGSLTTPGAPPQIDRTRGFFIATDDDAFNRTLHVMWAGGLLDAEIDEAFLQGHSISLPLRLEVGSFRRFMPEIGAVAPDDAPIRLRTEAGLPPIVRMAGAPDVVVLQAGEFAVDILVDRAKDGTFEKLLRAVVHMEIGGNLTLSNDGLRIASLSTPRLRFDLVEEPMVEIDDRRLEVLLSVILTPTIPHMLNSLRVIGIPHLNQLTTFNVDVYVDGAQRERLVVAGDMTR